MNVSSNLSHKAVTGVRRTRQKRRASLRCVAVALSVALTMPIAVGLALVATPQASAQSVAPQTVNYSCTAFPQYFSVPPSVTELTITASGAAGDDAPHGGGNPGKGALLTGVVVPVGPGQPLDTGSTVRIDVGCRKHWGGSFGGFGSAAAFLGFSDGGNGGGATTVRNESTNAYVVVAGGGGGAGGTGITTFSYGGDGGDGGATPTNGSVGIGLGAGYGGAGGGSVSAAGGNGGPAGAFDRGGGGGGGGGGYTQGGAGGGGGQLGGGGGGGGGAGQSYVHPSSISGTRTNAATVADGTLIITYTGVDLSPQRFSCKAGAIETYLVPAGVTRLKITAVGADGGAAGRGAYGVGDGVEGTISATPYEALRVGVGCAGGGNNSSGGGSGGLGLRSAGVGGGGDGPAIGGGGGGGASGVARQTTILFMAAAGGGGGGNGDVIGCFGGNAGNAGQDGLPGACLNPGAGGTAGGAGTGSEAGTGDGGIGCTACSSGGGGGGGAGYATGQGGGAGGIGASGGGGGGGGTSLVNGPGTIDSAVLAKDYYRLGVDRLFTGGLNGLVYITPIYTRTEQTITFSGPGLVEVGSSSTLVATATSGLTVQFAVLTPSTCSLSGAVVSFTAVGDCLVRASQPGNALYSPAEPVDQTIVVLTAKLNQTITFNGPTTAEIGTSYPATPTASSGLPVSLTIFTPAVCSYSGGVVTFNALGQCFVLARQFGDSTYNAAADRTVITVVTKKAQTISFTGPVFGVVGGTYNIAASASSGLPVTVSPTAASSCTITGGVVTFNAVGICTVIATQTGDALYAPAPSVQVRTSITTVPVGKSDQTITFTMPAVGAVGDQYTATATASSGLPVVLRTSSASCSVSGDVVTFVAIGSCIVDAFQDGDSSFNRAPTVSATTSVKQGQVITFDGPSDDFVGGSYRPRATSTSGLSVTLSVDASSVGCTLSAGGVSFVSAGSCVISANQAGNIQFAPAVQVQVITVIVARALQNQTITFTGPSSGVVGGGYTPTATSSSGLPVVFAVDASSVGCTLSAGVVSFVAAGSCVIDANQPGNATFNAAPEVKITTAVVVVVVKQNQTIIFTGPSSGIVGGVYTPNATASSGLPVVLTVDASSVGCTLTGGVVSFVSAGSCVINANQAGNATFNAAPEMKVTTVVVAKQNQTITFTGPATGVVGGGYTPTATASSGLPVVLAVDASSVGCTLSGGVLAFTAAGSCVISANQAGNAVFNAAPEVKVTTAVVAKQNQTITFTGPATGTVGGGYTPTATASSGLAVTLAVDASSVGCTLSGGVVAFTAAGSCVISANQTGNATFNAAPEVKVTTVVAAKQSQMITFTGPATGVVGGGYTPTATATSGLPVVLAVDASSTGCTLTAGVVSFVSAGSCVITANQAGNATFNAAPEVKVTTVVVAKQDQTITFTGPSSGTVGGRYTPTATASSGLPVVFTIDASSTGCTLTGVVVSFVSAGSCVITANQAGNATFNAAPEVQATTVVVGKADLVVTKTVSSQVVLPGRAGVTFTITVKNNGPHTADRVTVTDVVPAGLIVTGTTVTRGTVALPTWDVGNLASGQTATMTLTVTVPELRMYTAGKDQFGNDQPATGGEDRAPISYRNCASATSTAQDLVPANNTACATVTRSWNGRTPGYWKNNPAAWPTGTSNQTLGQVFTSTAGITGCRNLKPTTTLAQALTLKGGSDLCGKLEILMRAATAAYLNERTFATTYPATDVAALTTAVNTVITSAVIPPTDLVKITDLATKLDTWNNGIE